MLIEIFKAGTHTDSAGNTRTWTEEDLDTIVKKYNPAVHEAPVVIGHPKDNAPAYGWVEKLERKGNVLYAKLKDLVPEFVEWVKKGLYKKRSISLYPDMTLRHVGFLGAMPPAVKGLADVAFSAETDAVTIEFADYRVPLVGKILQRLRDFLIDKYDIETADKIISNWEIEELQREPIEAVAETSTALSENTKNKGGQDMDKVKELEVKLKEAETVISEYAEKDKEKEDEIVRLKKELDEERAKRRRMEFQAFCEGLMEEGKLTPAMKPIVLDFLEILTTVEETGEYEFTEGNGKVKASPLERFKAFLNLLPKQVEFRELATKDKAASGPEMRNFKDLSGWELIEMYKTDPQAFRELAEKI